MRVGADAAARDSGLAKGTRGSTLGAGHPYEVDASLAGEHQDLGHAIESPSDRSECQCARFTAGRPVRSRPPWASSGLIGFVLHRPLTWTDPPRRALGAPSHRAAHDRYERLGNYRGAGASGLELPAFSFGLWQKFGTDRPYATQREIVLHAFDLGITHFDNANRYGPPPRAAEVVREKTRGT